jgi:hypothetical protein
MGTSLSRVSGERWFLKNVLNVALAAPDAFGWFAYISAVPDAFDWFVYISAVPDAFDWFVYISAVPDAFDWLVSIFAADSRCFHC